MRRSLEFEFGGQIHASRIETGQLGELRLGIAAELDAVQRLPWEPKPAFSAVASFYATH